MNLKDILALNLVQVRSASQGVWQTLAQSVILGITDDSRQVQPGWVFVCCIGEQVNASQFIPDAIAAGAIAIIVDAAYKDSETFSPIPIFQTQDAFHTLGVLAATFYGFPGRDLCMIGVTGTTGKTSITHFIERILTHHGQKVGLLGTLGFKPAFQNDYTGLDLTTPKATALQALLYQLVKEDYQTVVMEVSSHALDQDRVYGCDFDIVVFSNLSQEHLDYHHTMGKYCQTKTKLFQSLSPDSESPKTAVINLDDPYAAAFVQACPPGTQIMGFGLTHPDGQVQAENICYTISGTTFDLKTPQGVIPMILRTVGQFEVYNTLAAVATALSLGIPLSVIQAALKDTPGLEGRFELIHHQPGILIDYAHSPDGLKNLLTAARIITPPPGKLILVFGCGGDRDPSKRPQMGAIAEQLADKVIITSDNPRHEDPQQIITDILTGIARFQSDRMWVDPDRQRAIQHAIEIADPNDLIVIAGRGHEENQVFANQTIPFKDRAVALAYLEKANTLP